VALPFPGTVSLDGRTVLMHPYEQSPMFLDVATGKISKLTDELPEPYKAATIFSSSINAEATKIVFDTSVGVTEPGYDRHSLLFERGTRRLTELGPIAFPQISGDDSRLIYSAGTARLGGNTFQRYAKALPNGEPESIIVGPPGSGAPRSNTYTTHVSFDGQRVFFQNNFDDGVLHTYMRDLQSKTTVRTSFDGNTALLSIAPDGNSYAEFLYSPSRPTVLQIMSEYPGTEKPWWGSGGSTQLARSVAMSRDAKKRVWITEEKSDGGIDTLKKTHLTYEEQIGNSARKDQEIILPADVTGEVYSLSSVQGSGDIAVLVVCADVKVTLAPQPAQTTGSTLPEPRAPGQFGKTKCFLHRR
jgi:hypothetical protein